MRRYWIPKNAVHGDRVSFSGDTLHHIRDVCRQHIGAKFEVILTDAAGPGSALLVEIVSESKNESLGRVLERRAIPELPRPHIHLAMSVPRISVFEAVLEKAVELGVAAIHPFFSDFSFLRTRSQVFDGKRERFEKIVRGATQQSGRGDWLSLGELTGFAEALQTFNRTPCAAGLFAYEGESRLSVREGVARIRGNGDGQETGGGDHAQPQFCGLPADVWIFVGSEGGFSEREVEEFQLVGLSSVTLGPQVLRVETACVALVSIIKYEFDLMR